MFFRRKNKQTEDETNTPESGTFRLRFRRVPRAAGVELQVEIAMFRIDLWWPLRTREDFGEDWEALVAAINDNEGVVYANEGAIASMEAAITREFEKWRDLQYQQRAAKWYGAPAREAESEVGREMAFTHYNGNPLVLGHRTMLSKAMLMDMAMSPEDLAELVSADWHEGIVQKIKDYRAEQYDTAAARIRREKANS